MNRTALLAGGESPEREVSLSGGRMILPSLLRAGIDAFAFDPAERPLSDLTLEKVGRAFNILHGGSGENGEVQGALKMAGIPCTGSGVLASALAMDKHRAKLLWKAAGVPTPEWRLAYSENDAGEIAESLGFPLFVKPSCGGSSTCAGAANSLRELPAAIAAALAEGAPALIEKRVVGEEYTAAILDGESLPLVRIVPAAEFYDYRAKYISDETRFFCPCGLSAADESRLQNESLRAFNLLGCRHWGRADFILAEDGPMFLEINTIPGMTSHSLVPIAAKAAGMEYDELALKIWQGAA